LLKCLNPVTTIVGNCYVFVKNEYPAIVVFIFVKICFTSPILRMDITL